MAQKEKTENAKKSLAERFAEKKAKEEREAKERQATATEEKPEAEIPKEEKPKKEKKSFKDLFKKKHTSNEEKKTIPEESAAEKTVDEKESESAKERDDKSPKEEVKVVEKPKAPSKISNFFKKKTTKTKLSEVQINDAKKSIEKDDDVKKVVKKERKSFLHKQKKKQKRERRTALQKRRILSNLLMKAGYEVNAEKLQKVVFYVALSMIGVFTLLTLVVAAASGKSAGGLLVFYFGLWTAVFALTYIFIWMIIYFYLDIRIYRRTMELEDVLPDFLQLASANISAGMPIDRALWFAVRPNFGVLAKEIEEVAKATLAGEELDKSLIKFTERYDSVTLKRSISILLEGLGAGGEIAELLNKIALNIQETKIQRKEMSANVATYAIFITFASIVMAPLLFALATELLSIIVQITSSLDMSSSSGSFLTLNINTSAGMIKDFRNFCILMLTISALMSASIVSVIRRGRIKEGLRNLPIFVIVSLVLYFFASSLLHSMLGNLI